MAKINLSLWEDPNFPSLDILESRTKVTLEAFNKCRILDIKLRTNDDKIENFCREFNTLTNERAVESLRLSLYIEDVIIYIQLLSKENTSVGVILETLLSLLDTAQARQKNTKKLKKNYEEFLERFNKEVTCSVPIYNYNSTENHIVIREPPSRKIISLKSLNIILISISVLFGYGVFKFSCSNFGSNAIHRFFSIIPSFLNLIEESIDIRNLDEQNHKSSDMPTDKPNSDLTKNDSPKDDSPKEYHPSEQNPFSGTSMNEGSSDSSGLISYISRLFNSFKGNGQSKNNNTKNIQSVASKSTSEPASEPTSEPTSISEPSNHVKETKFDAEYNSSLPCNGHSVTSASPGLTDHRICTPAACFLGFTACLFMYGILRQFKPKQYRWWMKFFGNGHQRRSSKRTEEIKRQQIIEKNEKILEIKEKLPIIVQSVGILDQFWDNQIINIKAHVETLKSVDENEEFKIPRQRAIPIEDHWTKQLNGCKANHIRLKDLVTYNSLLPID
ncbi:6356_t:CDS:2 [Funneliformis geosporum]|uniref:18073_t:CDS:1 n=1 Tax=Funneliformis geosporum TaxID=1117311 RepID=A0A9W4WIV1_9GLOM|nr:18073_t:CDS:2 [Funneliformis geosporum]CAI2166545.1 6356_t:CDS:2 [Funneliformis geosporum]